MLAGKVTRIEGFGLGFVKHEETNEQFAFTFDKIAGYRGELPGKLGFHVGADVTFHLSNGLIDVIQAGNTMNDASSLSPAGAASFGTFKT